MAAIPTEMRITAISTAQLPTHRGEFETCRLLHGFRRVRYVRSLIQAFHYSFSMSKSVSETLASNDASSGGTQYFLNFPTNNLTIGCHCRNQL